MRHCLISAMSEGRLSAHSNETSDRPACTDLVLEKNEKEASKIQSMEVQYSCSF